MVKEETETVCVFDPVDKIWNIYSCVRAHMNKLTKLYGKPYNVQRQDGEIVSADWKVSEKCLSFRAPERKKRVFTEEQKQAAAARMSKARAARSK